MCASISTNASRMRQRFLDLMSASRKANAAASFCGSVKSLTASPRRSHEAQLSIHWASLSSHSRRFAKGMPSAWLAASITVHKTSCTYPLPCVRRHCASLRNAASTDSTFPAPERQRRFAALRYAEARQPIRPATPGIMTPMVSYCCGMAAWRSSKWSASS